MSKRSERKDSGGEWERWNTHETTVIEQEMLGTVLQLNQNPSSEHLGTTVWDASVVLAKWLEKNIRKGELARTKVRGKRCIELGAGMGLAGMALAMVGADVLLTDTEDVLPLLRQNVDNNLSPAHVRLVRSQGHGTWADSAGTVAVAELDWLQLDEQLPLLRPQPPFDYVLATDCVYHEHLVEKFHAAVMAVTNDKSTVIVCNELRSHSVHNRFMELFGGTHTMKKIPHAKMDDKYQHPNIQIFIMKRRRKGQAQAGGGAEDGDGEDAEDAAAAEEASHPGPSASTALLPDGVINGSGTGAEDAGPSCGAPAAAQQQQEGGAGGSSIDRPGCMP